MCAPESVEQNVCIPIDNRTWNKPRCEDSRKGCPYNHKVVFTISFTLLP